MNRRSLLKGLLGLPALVLAKFLPVSTSEWLVNWGDRNLESKKFYSLADYVRDLGPEPSLLPVVEALSQRNRFLEDIPWVEGSSPIGHRVIRGN